MNCVAVEPKKVIEWRYGALTIRLGHFTLSVYCKWHIWVKKYKYLNFRKVNAGKGFSLMCWPLHITYQKPAPSPIHK